MSNSVQPHRWQLTRLPHPWDSPGKNTGVGCHFLLQCMKVKSQREVAQSCLTLRDSTDCSPPGSSVQGIFQARVLEWGAIAFSKGIATTCINLNFCSCSRFQKLSLIPQNLFIFLAYLKFFSILFHWLRSVTFLFSCLLF